MREQLATDLQGIGERLFAVRSALNGSFPFVGGMIRACEEVLLIVVNTLRDTNVQEENL